MAKQEREHVRDGGVRLIDANALMRSLPTVDLNSDVSITKSGAVADMVCLISNAPTIDAEPVRHGKWSISLDGITPFCTECGRTHRFMDGVPNYCPNCGAKMDKEGS